MQTIGTPIEVRYVSTSQDEQAFLDLPARIYQGDANWVPPLRSGVAENFAADNPFFEYGELERLLAVRDGQVLGRIVPAINRRLIEKEGCNIGLFGFFECVEDFDVAQTLLNAAQDWLRKRGMERVRGPIDLSTHNNCLFLVEGFDSPPMFMMPYNPPYYPQFLERLGWQKAKDAVAYILPLDIAPTEVLKRGYEVGRKSGLNFRRIDTAQEQFEAECRRIYQLFTANFADNWSYSPRTEAEFLREARQLRALIDPNGVWIAEDPARNNEMIGLILGVPDYNLVLRHLNGRLGWWGTLKFLWYRRTINQGRVMIVTALPEYRRKMVPLALVYLILTQGGQGGKKYQRAELSWVWEDNWPSRKLIEASGGQVHKTYRIYEKAL
ncbi:hypothetical protein [Leptolyngbya sp. FACHB-261]|uniref:hypothetical protein n=1 Tax=Leptolyngbya sp. FACHB-261 TaxID=2692806 RepID=UPI001688995A|nr:hypothetical protein [Leptolyngbya sp. FACHB-261]MBD2102154.1 hypothetical protein [Leptolyngbya sp. FACHB-261]